MPVRCAVCSKSFKDSSALQMHEATKRHISSIAGKTQGKSIPNNDAKIAPNSSNTRPTTRSQVRNSSSLNFYCKQCNRWFKSREAIEAHTKAKHHTTATPRSQEKGPVTAAFGCEICGRYDFGSLNVLKSHKCNAEGYQASDQDIAPPKPLADSGTVMNHGLPLNKDHAFPLRIDKSVQCNLCSCGPLGNETYESSLAPHLWEGQESQTVPFSNAANPYPQDSKGWYENFNAISYQVPTMYAYSEATSQLPALAEESYSNIVPKAVSPVFASQPASTDFLMQIPLNPQLPSSTTGICRFEPSGSLQFLGKEWSRIRPSEQPFVFKMLSGLCHSLSDLERYDYRLRKYTLADLMEKRKCNICQKQQRLIQQRNLPCKATLRTGPRLLRRNELQTPLQGSGKQVDHGNDALSLHTFPTIDERKRDRYLKSSWAPEKDPQRPKCVAVALDCEMVDVVGNGGLWREVVKISVVDFLSGETLLNTLVLPTAKVKRWKTEITGITEQMMNIAKAQGHTVKGWTEARSQLWQYVDAATILIGQSLQYDLDVLGMLHARVVDSAILASKAIDLPSKKTFGLKKMCKEMLEVDIQCLNGGIHEPLEDTLASRELVLYFIHNPREFQIWAESKRKEELAIPASRKKQRNGGTKAAVGQDQSEKNHRVSSGRDDPSNLFYVDDVAYDDNDDDDEILRWEDIAEDCGWPHPDTGYDPWSD